METKKGNMGDYIKGRPKKVNMVVAPIRHIDVIFSEVEDLLSIE